MSLAKVGVDLGEGAPRQGIVGLGSSAQVPLGKVVAGLRRRQREGASLGKVVVGLGKSAAGLGNAQVSLSARS